MACNVSAAVRGARRRDWWIAARCSGNLTVYGAIAPSINGPAQPLATLLSWGAFPSNPGNHLSHSLTLGAVLTDLWPQDHHAAKRITASWQLLVGCRVNVEDKRDTVIGITQSNAWRSFLESMRPM
jgi:hypothetical protein